MKDVHVIDTSKLDPEARRAMIRDGLAEWRTSADGRGDVLVLTAAGRAREKEIEHLFALQVADRAVDMFKQTRARRK